MARRNNSGIRNSITGNSLSIDSIDREKSSSIEIAKSDLEKYIAAINEIYEGKSKSIGTKETTTKSNIDGKKLNKTMDTLVDLSKKQLGILGEIHKSLKKPKEATKQLESVKAKSVLDVIKEDEESEQNGIQNTIRDSVINRILGGGRKESGSRNNKKRKHKPSSTLWQKTKSNIGGIGAVVGGAVYTGYNLLNQESDLDKKKEEINIMIENGEISPEEGSKMIEAITKETRQEQKKEGIMGIGGIAGGLAGAKLLGGIGSIAGPVGGLVGSVVGGIGGSILGSMGGEAFHNHIEGNSNHEKSILDGIIDSTKETIEGITESDKFKSIISEVPKQISEFVLSVPDKLSKTIDSVSNAISPSEKIRSDFKMIDNLKKETIKLEKGEEKVGNQNINISSTNNNITNSGDSGFTPTPRRDTLSSLDRYLDKVSNFI